MAASENFLQKKKNGMKGKIDKSTIITGNFNSPLSVIRDQVGRKLVRL